MFSWVMLQNVQPLKKQLMEKLIKKFSSVPQDHVNFKLYQHILCVYFAFVSR